MLKNACLTSRNVVKRMQALLGMSEVLHAHILWVEYGYGCDAIKLFMCETKLNNYPCKNTF